MVFHQQKKDYEEMIADGMEADFLSFNHDIDIIKNWESPKVVVYSISTFDYAGGAHGMYTTTYKTINKESEQVLEFTIDPTYLYELQPLLRKGLRENFENCSDEELNNFLFIEDGIIPLPGSTPSFAEDGILFIYQPYEIAPYAAGCPSFTIPYDAILPYLMPEARALVTK